MTVKKRSTAPKSKRTGSDMKKVDAYVLGPNDYEEIPEHTDDWFERADLYRGRELIRRGRPPSPSPKRAVSLRLDDDIVTYYRRTGRGWQSRINAALRKAAKLPKEKRKKA